MINLPSHEQLQRAVQLSAEVERIQQEIKQLLSGEAVATVESSGVAVKAGSSASSPVPAGRNNKGKRSAAARANMAAAQRAAWAKRKGQQASGESPGGAKVGKDARATTKRPKTMSAEARAKIGEATRQRWAKKKAAV